MIRNRSTPSDVLIPVIGYPSVSDAVAWLADAFGFELRWQVAAHRARARAAGADVSVVGEFPCGERQYSAVDFAGRTWVLTESIVDPAPGDWGVTTRESSNAH